MKAEDEEMEKTLETWEDSGVLFGISINFETDQSQDGGYTFERETGSFELRTLDAKKLRDELNAFLSENSKLTQSDEQPTD